MSFLKFTNERELQNDLAEHLRDVGYLTFTEIDIKGGRGGRADIVAVKPSYANKDCRIYEVKYSRSTFDTDFKYEKYFDVCHRLYIACPKGLIQKKELPTSVGLIVRGEKGWHTVKAAKRNSPDGFNIDFVLSLLYRGYEETRKQRDLRERIIAKENATLKEHANKIGYEIARRLDGDRETQVEEWVTEISKLFKDYLNIEVATSSNSLPCKWSVKRILSAVSGTLREVDNIRRIGEYLCNLDLPEENEKQYYRSLCELRKTAMRNIT